MNKGYVYFLANRTMPNLIKIGYTRNTVEKRISQLNGTNIPEPFQIVAQFYVLEPALVESKIHDALRSFRVKKNREFFNCSVKVILEKSVSIISESLIQDFSSDSVDSKYAGISKISEKILHLLIKNRLQGCFEFDFINKEINQHTLVIESELESLREKGHVQKRSDKWEITRKGVKLMFDTGLLQEESLEKPYNSSSSDIELNLYDFNDELDISKGNKFTGIDLSSLESSK